MDPIFFAAINVLPISSDPPAAPASHIPRSRRRDARKALAVMPAQ